MKKAALKLYPLLSIDESTSHFEGLEDGRNHLQYRVFFWIGAAFIALFTLISAIYDRHFLTMFLGGCLTFILVTNIFIIRTGDLRIAGWLYSSALVLLVLFLIWHGGVAFTGPLWAYPIIVIMISLLGHVYGLTLVLLMIALSAILMGWGFPVTPQVEYSPQYQFRYHATMLALAGLAWGIEYSRAKAYHYMRDFNHKLEQASRTDQLTGALNRRGIQERYTAEVNRYSRKGDLFTMLLIDVDNFKSVNDRKGHKTGDQILCELTRQMLSDIRNTDTLGRWGGEEFMILLGQTPPDEGLVIAEKLRRRIQLRSDFADGKVADLTISIGLAGYRKKMALLEMADIADKALYAAKSAGKNCVAVA